LKNGKNGFVKGKVENTTKSIMRVLILNYEYPPLGGGAGNATYFLAREWGRKDIKVDVVTTWFSGLKDITYESDNITVYRVRSKRKKADRSNVLEMLSYVLLGQKKTNELCDKNKYDLIVSFFSIPSGIIARATKKRYRIPYIVLLRGGDVPGFLPRQLGWFHALTMPLTKGIWRDATRIIANSKSLRDLAMKTGSRIKRSVEMAPNGVDVDFFRPGTNRAEKPFIFIFAGRFVPQKNLPYLLRQFELTNKNGVARLILVGDGPERSAIAAQVLASKELEATVLLYPWSTKEDLLCMYQSSHCIVNPSLEEGMPNTLLEAMSCGLPAIASDIGGNNELVENGKNGYLFDLHDAYGLSKRMQDIMRGTDSDAMGAYSRALAVAKYAWAASAEQILENAGNAI
jgi:glycosyltransferase involved in cell wall biosynthesis